MRGGDPRLHSTARGDRRVAQRADAGERAVTRWLTSGGSASATHGWPTQGVRRVRDASRCERSSRAGALLADRLDPKACSRANLIPYNPQGCTTLARQSMPSSTCSTARACRHSATDARPRHCRGLRSARCRLARRLLQRGRATRAAALLEVLLVVVLSLVERFPRARSASRSAHLSSAALRLRTSERPPAARRPGRRSRNGSCHRRPAPDG